MTSPPPPGSRRGPSNLGGCLFATVLVTSGVILAVVLTQECASGRDAVNSYVARVRAGEAVGAAVAGDEAESLTRILRRGTALATTNFQGQAGTSCHWVTVSGPDGDVEVAFLLAGEGDAKVVRGVSAARTCECPDPDVERPCFLHVTDARSP